MRLQQDVIRGADSVIKTRGKQEKASDTTIETWLAGTPQWSSLMSNLDRIGGYTSNIANMQTDPTLAEMRKQTTTLSKIERNTEKTSARYS